MAVTMTATASNSIKETMHTIKKSINNKAMDRMIMTTITNTIRRSNKAIMEGMATTMSREPSPAIIFHQDHD